MHRIEKAGTQSDSSPFTFVLSDESVDRMGDVVVQSGMSLTQFKRNPIALFSHQSRQPIGTWENIRREGVKLLADLKLAKAGTSRMIDEVRSLIEQRILRACSIGFAPVKSEPIDPEQPYAGQRYTKTELLEASIVAVPANANALALRSLSPEMKSLLESASRMARPLPSSMKGKTMTLSEKIKAANARRDAISTRLNEIKALAENADMNDEQRAEIDTLIGEDESVERELEAMKKLEAKLADTAVAQNRGVMPGYSPAIVRAPGNGMHAEKPGTLLVRFALCAALAHIERKGIEQVAAERYGSDQRVGAIIKTATGSADTTTVGWAKELVSLDVAAFLQSLVNVSAYAALAAKSMVIDFGTAGSVSVPFRTGGTTDLAGAWVGEGGAIPVKRGTIGGALLNRYKLAVISTLTKELSRSSTPQAETLIRQMMEDDTSTALDQYFFSAMAAVAGVNPAGIVNGQAAIAASVLANKVDAAIADLSAIVGAIVAAGNGRRIVIAMNTVQRLALSSMYSAGTWMFKDEIARGQIAGVDLVTSGNIPVGDVFGIDAANLVSALGTPEFDASDVATIVMANADGVAPTHATGLADRTIIGTAEKVPPDGGLAVHDLSQDAAGKVGLGVQAVSMFQTWQIALRTIVPISWAKGRAGSVQWVDGVSW